MRRPADVQVQILPRSPFNMTANQLMKLVEQRKSVVGFHWHRTDIRMPAAFVANMQFTFVMKALPRMMEYVPKQKHNTKIKQ